AFSSLFLLLPRPPAPTLFPYTTLFRSRHARLSRPGARLRPDGQSAAVLVDELHAALIRACVDLCRGARASHQRQPGSGRGVKLRSEEHTSELQSLTNIVCRLLLEKKKA